MTGLQELAAAISNAAANETHELKQSRRLRGLLKRRAKAIFLERLDQLDDLKMDKTCSAIRQGETTLQDAALDLLGAAFR
ncbi:MAG: hypothetical protein GJ676_05675 [Rhodobacteraceae bacterium]|nr:hypothetical protein [Paracoccaceae bacterium]